MSRRLFGTRFHPVVGAVTAGSGRRERRPGVRRSPQVESLEGRALMATINASATISSVADGNNFNYTLTLSNSSSSNSGIGTFWYSWVPGEDLMATRPISVSPPAGWTEIITNAGSTDGFGIEFLASSSASAVQPGSSLTFSFVSADSPASLTGNSAHYPGTPVDTSTVYPGAPFSDAGHEFTVTPVSAPTSTSTPAPLVTVVSVEVVKNKKHLVTEIVVDFSGPVNAAEADNIANYRLATANGKRSFTAMNSPVLKLRSALFNPANDTVTLTPKKAFALTKAVELTIRGMAPLGLQDSSGQFIDGDDDGAAGSNAVALIRRNRVTLNPPAARNPFVLGPPVVMPQPPPWWLARQNRRGPWPFNDHTLAHWGNPPLAASARDGWWWRRWRRWRSGGGGMEVAVVVRQDTSTTAQRGE